MIEKVDPLSEVDVCVLAVRVCASARGRLSTVLVGGRLSRNHTPFAMFMPTSFRMICSDSEFLMLCVVRSVGWCCRLVPGLGIVGCAILGPFVVVLCLWDGCHLDARVPLCFLRASGKSGSFIFVCFVVLGVAGTFQTHIDGFSLIV